MPPTLEGSVDEPAAGSQVGRGPLVVAGWHAWAGRRVLAVAVTVSSGGERGEPVVALTGIDRPDVEAHLGPGTDPSTGWSATVGLPAGISSARLEVTVWPSPSGAPTTLPAFDLAVKDIPPPPFEAALDAPGPGTVLPRGIVEIWGWAVDRIGPVDRIEISVNGGVPVRARPGIAREDLRDRFEVPRAVLAGFSELLDLSGLPAGDAGVRLEVVAHRIDAPPEVVVDDTFPLEPAAVPPPAPTPGAAPVPTGSGPARAVGEGGGLNLLVFTHRLTLGGAQLWLSELLDRAGAGRDFPCTVLSEDPGPLRAGLEELGIEVQVTGRVPVDDVEVYEGRMAQLSAVARDGGYTAVLANTVLAFPGADLARRLGLPSVWGVHESYSPAAFWPAAYPPGQLHPAVREVALASLASTSALVFEAEATRRLWEPAAGPGRTVVVPYGVDTAAIDRFSGSTSPARARAALAIPGDGPLILVMGTLEPRKAQTVVAQAFDRLASDHPDAVLALVGMVPGPDLEALTRYVSEAGLESRCLLVPLVADTFTWYRAADLLVCASDVESMPRTVLEAMAFGIPVVSTDVFGLAELLSDGETGFLFPARSLVDLEGAMRRALTLPAGALAEVGSAGSALVHDRYDSAGYAREILALLRGLLDRPGALPGELLGRG